MKKTIRIMCVLSLILFLSVLTSCGNKLSPEEEKIFDAFTEKLLTTFKDVSTARIVKVDKYYESGKYVVLTLKGTNSYGGTITDSFILFLENVVFTEEFCEEFCEESIKRSIDVYEDIGIGIYGYSFSKGDYYEIEDIPSTIGKCTLKEASIKAMLTGDTNEDVTINVGMLNKKITEYIEDMGW